MTIRRAVAGVNIEIPRYRIGIGRIMARSGWPRVQRSPIATLFVLGGRFGVIVVRRDLQAKR